MRQSPLLFSILAALAACSTESGEACMEVEATVTSCPAPESVDPANLFTPNSCVYEVEEVTGKGTRKKIATQASPELEVCCYPAELSEEHPGCVIGRPFFDGGAAVTAPLTMAGGDPIVLDSLRGAAWARAAAGEHASVAAFGRLSLSLMRLGAPLALLRDVHRAALDEITHAELCFDLAVRYGAPRLKPGAFPIDVSVDLDVDLKSLAVAAVREGCLTETLGAHVVAIAAELAVEPEVRAVLSRIADEEAKHAVLSFRLVAWALRAGGDDVRAAVREAFAAPWPALDLAELALRTGVDVARLRAAADDGVTEILRPAAAALLAA